MKSGFIWLGCAVVVASLAAPATGCSDDASPGAGGGGATSGGGSPATGGASTTSTGGSAPLPHSFKISGRVLDRHGAPVEGAITMQGGGSIPTKTTGADGKYEIVLTRAIPGTPTVVTAKVGFRSGAVELHRLPEGAVDVTMIEVEGEDNGMYAYGDPGTGVAAHDDTTQFCGHCHTTFTAQFQRSAHARAAKDPLVQDLYAGVTEAHADQTSCEASGGAWRTGRTPGQPAQATKRCYVGSGVLPDLNPGCASGSSGCDDPATASSLTAFGQCADCHAPGIPGEAGGHDLLEARGLAYDDGNHCDFCHHVADVDLGRRPGAGGALIVHRSFDHTVEGQFPPSPLIQVMYGPLPDVPNAFMGGSWQPKFKSAELCAGCHEQKQDALVPGTALDSTRWPDGLPTHSTYSEWLGSGFATPCQDCHLPPDDTGLTNSVDVTRPDDSGITFGFPRPPRDIRQHLFKGPLFGTPRFIDGALTLGASAIATGSEIAVSVEVANTVAGHAVPTGEPMRALVLAVAGDACGAPLLPSGGMTISDVGGAIAAGRFGVDVAASGATLTWGAGAAVAKPGDVVRVVRASGTFDDYAGIGFFANPALTPAEKGIEIAEPIGEARVVAAGAGSVSLDAALAFQAGDLVYLGEAAPSPFDDGAGSRALAGAPGAVFSRILLDASGARAVPHYRAVDLASDNRIPPGAAQRTSHRFVRPSGCASATLRATLLYRPAPVAESRLRGWAAKDFVIAKANVTVALP